VLPIDGFVDDWQSVEQRLQLVGDSVVVEQGSRSMLVLLAALSTCVRNAAICVIYLQEM
jgi:hypothetical protein